MIAEQLNNNETTDNHRNEPTLSAKKYVEKLPSSTYPADNNFVSSDVDNCINNIRGSKMKNAKKTSQQCQQITKRLLIAGDSIVKNIELYKMKKSAKYDTTVKSITEATTEGMSHHVKGCMVDFAPDIVCGTSDLKKDLFPQKIAQKVLKLVEEVSDGGKRDLLVSGIINRGDDYHAKVQKVNEFLPEIRTSKNVKYKDNGNIGLDMLNRR